MEAKLACEKKKRVAAISAVYFDYVLKPEEDHLVKDAASRLEVRVDLGGSRRVLQVMRDLEERSTMTLGDRLRVSMQYMPCKSRWTEGGCQGG